MTHVLTHVLAYSFWQHRTGFSRSEKFIPLLDAQIAGPPSPHRCPTPCRHPCSNPSPCIKIDDAVLHSTSKLPTHFSWA